MAAGIIDSDQCDLCGVRATTEHIFWHCKKYTQLRKRFLEAKAKILGDQKKHRPNTYKRLAKAFKKPASPIPASAQATIANGRPTTSLSAKLTTLCIMPRPSTR